MQDARRPLRITALALAVIVPALATACNIPFHATQSPNIEAYHQRFTICTGNTHGKPWRDVLIPLVFGANPDDVQAERADPELLVVEGSVFFRIVSVPDHRHEFVIEGYGSHIVYFGRLSYVADRGGAGADDSYRILATADYRIDDDGPISVADLDSGSLTVRTVVRSVLWAIKPEQFAGDRQAPPVSRSEIYIRIYLRKLAHDVYAIDYTREHDIGVALAVNGPRRLVVPVGSMQFAFSESGRGIFDLRHLDSFPLADDYESLSQRRAWLPGRAGIAPLVAWQPRVACPLSPAGGRQ